MEEEAFERWSAAVADLPPDKRRPDGWTLREVVAHFAAWHRAAAHRLERLGAGESLPPPAIDAFNGRVREEVRDRSWSDVEAEARAAREAFLATIAELPDELLAAQDGLGAFIAEANGSSHYLEHLDDFARPDR